LAISHGLNGLSGFQSVESVESAANSFTPWLTIYTISHYSAFMALNIKNAEVERLTEEIAMTTGETKTEAIRKALLERRSRLASQSPPEDRREKLRRFLEEDVWPKVPRRALGRRVTKKEREEILGYGSRGV
jgi:antitoxin VapB